VELHSDYGLEKKTDLQLGTLQGGRMEQRYLIELFIPFGYHLLGGFGRRFVTVDFARFS
jgi:hypothetical protein